MTGRRSIRRGAVPTMVVMIAGILTGVMGMWLAGRPQAAKSDMPTTHGEWVFIPSGPGDSLRAYVAYPERKDRAPAVIVIHEIFGLSDWVRSVADSLAAAGFVALAPDLLTRRGTTRGVDDPRRVIRELPPDSITVDLDATFAYLQSLKAVRPGATGVIGFCWGGGQSFRYATNNPGLKGAVVCYGPGPDSSTVGRIRAPVFGVYAQNDARINAALQKFV